MPHVLRDLKLATAVARQVADLVDARAARVAEGQSLVQPSDYWADFISNFIYVFELSDASLDRLRLHTYHLTSDLYLRYYLAGKDDAERLLARYGTLTEALRSHALAEPYGGIGYPHEDGLVSWDLLRYMSVARDLLEAKVLEQRTSSRIVEIGGGYGGLCRVMARLNPRVQYSIVDLEETLFFSKSYLDRTLSGFDVRLIRRAIELEHGEKRINLVPQHLAEELELEFDLGVNHQSMQEMQVAQIDRYLDWISHRCAAFYSRNLRHHDPRIALLKGLSLDVHSRVLTRFPEVLWKANSAQDEGVSDENLGRFVVNARQARRRGAPDVGAGRTGMAAGARIEERAIHTGTMLDAYEVPVGSSFAVTLSARADALALTFVTWGMELSRLGLAMVVRDSERGIIRHAEAIRLGFCDWDEVVFDLRGTSQGSRITLEVSLRELEGQGRLGLPLFEPSAPGLCDLSTGGVPHEGHVPAGRLLVAAVR